VIRGIQLPFIPQIKYATSPVHVMWVTRLQDLPLVRHSTPNALAHAQAITQDLLQAAVANH
jgi:hypothetical protein